MTVTTLGIPRVNRGNSVDAGSLPATGPLVDTFDRIATDLRVSLTDRCNLRCTYCMPAEGLNWMPRARMLQPSELMRLLHIAVTRLGITNVRFTGGEPLMVPHLGEVVAATAALRPRPEIAITTNGLGLASRAQELAKAGLDRVNVSLDSVDARHYAAITRRDRLADVLAGLEAAKEAGLGPIKVNAVLDRVTGRGDLIPLVEFCLTHGYQLRIIEQMPLDAGRTWRRDDMLDAATILSLLRQRFTLSPDPTPRGSSPAQLWQIDGRGGSVGVIASVSQAFCEACDRTRLTADGQVRNCLFATHETDLLGLLRRGENDDTIEKAWRVAMWQKAAGHGIEQPGFTQPLRPMSAIGG